MRKLYNFKSLYKYVVESRDKIQKKIRIFIWIRLFLKIRIIIQKIRIPPSGSQMTKKIRIPAPESLIRPASSSDTSQVGFQTSDSGILLPEFISCQASLVSPSVVLAVANVRIQNSFNDFHFWHP